MPSQDERTQTQSGSNMPRHDILVSLYRLPSECIDLVYSMLDDRTVTTISLIDKQSYRDFEYASYWKVKYAKRVQRLFSYKKSLCHFILKHNYDCVDSLLLHYASMKFPEDLLESGAGCLSLLEDSYNFVLNVPKEKVVNYGHYIGKANSFFTVSHAFLSIEAIKENLQDLMLQAEEWRAKGLYDSVNHELLISNNKENKSALIFLSKIKRIEEIIIFLLTVSALRFKNYTAGELLSELVGQPLWYSNITMFGLDLFHDLFPDRYIALSHWALLYFCQTSDYSHLIDINEIDMLDVLSRKIPNMPTDYIVNAALYQPAIGKSLLLHHSIMSSFNIETIFKLLFIIHYTSLNLIFAKNGEIITKKILELSDPKITLLSMIRGVLIINPPEELDRVDISVEQALALITCILNQKEFVSLFDDETLLSLLTSLDSQHAVEEILLCDNGIKTRIVNNVELLKQLLNSTPFMMILLKDDDFANKLTLGAIHEILHHCDGEALALILSSPTILSRFNYIQLKALADYNNVGTEDVIRKRAVMLNYHLLVYQSTNLSSRSFPELFEMAIEKKGGFLALEELLKRPSVSYLLSKADISLLKIAHPSQIDQLDRIHNERKENHSLARAGNLAVSKLFMQEVINRYSPVYDSFLYNIVSDFFQIGAVHRELYSGFSAHYLSDVFSKTPNVNLYLEIGCRLLKKRVTNAGIYLLEGKIEEAHSEFHSAWEYKQYLDGIVSFGNRSANGCVYLFPYPDLKTKILFGLGVVRKLLEVPQHYKHIIETTQITCGNDFAKKQKMCSSSAIEQALESAIAIHEAMKTQNDRINTILRKLVKHMNDLTIKANICLTNHDIDKANIYFERAGAMKALIEEMNETIDSYYSRDFSKTPPNDRFIHTELKAVIHRHLHIPNSKLKSHDKWGASMACWLLNAIGFLLIVPGVVMLAKGSLLFKPRNKTEKVLKNSIKPEINEVYYGVRPDPIN